MTDALPNGLKYRAFLSYRSSDRKLAAWLHRKLETYRIPKRLVGRPGRRRPVPARLTPIFRDRDDARGTNDIETTIKDYLAQSEHLIVLCTPMAAQPDCWVGREIELFHRERPGAEVYAMIGGGSPPDCIPRQLLRRAADGVVHSPLAGDLRPPAEGGDGRHRAFIRLVAGLAGVEFDDLWRRERRRRQLAAAIWSTAIVAALVAGVVVLRDREAARVASLANAAQRLDPATNGALIDLLTIAAAPPARGRLIAPSEQQQASLEEIARRVQPAFAGSVAMRHQDLSAKIAFRSADRRLVFSTGDYDDRGLFVWNAASNKLVARLPVDSTYWSKNIANKPSDRDTGKAMGLDVSPNGLIVAAVYAPVQGEAWIAATWRLDAQGGCAAPCLPTTFAFAMPVPAPRFFLGRSLAELRLSADGSAALFVLPGIAPYAIDFAAKRAQPLDPLAGADLTRCSFAVPAESNERVRESDDATLPPTMANEHEGRWFSDDRNYVARLRPGERTVQFYSHGDRREVARLELPATTRCIVDCNVEVTFFDQGRRAAVSNREVDGADVMAGRVFGVVSLDACGFDAWPEVGPISLLSDRLPPVNGKRWQVHRVRSHVASRAGTHIAAVMTLSGDGYRDVGVIFGIRERRPTALFFPDLADPAFPTIHTLEAGDDDDSFRAWIESVIVAVEADGKSGSAQPAEAGGKPMSFWDGRVPSWHSRQDYGWEPGQWQLPGGRSERPTVIDSYGDKIAGLAVAPESGRLALAQSGAVFVQTAGTDPIAAAVTIPVAARRYDGLRFSPDAKVLAVSWSADIRDDAVDTVSVWDSASGALLAERKQESRTRLLAVGNDASVFIEKSGTAFRLNPRTGESRPIIKMAFGRMAWVEAHLVADDGSGHLVTIEPSTLETTALTELGKGERLQDIAANGKTIYSSGAFSRGDYFVDLVSHSKRQFLKDTQSGASSFFSRSGRLALVTGKFIDVWDSVGPERTARYAGPWDRLLAVWSSADDRELWALDSNGLLYRWSLVSDYADSVASACDALKQSGAPLTFTAGQIAAFPELA